MSIRLPGALRSITGQLLDPTVAERDAEDLLQKLWAPDLEQVVLPVDPVQIAKSFQAETFPTDLEEDVAGVISWQRDRAPMLYVNAGDDLFERRISCAHLLGHHIYRINEGIPISSSDQYVDFRGDLQVPDPSLEERYALQFGRALLMPRSVLVEHKANLKERNAGIAVLFQVPGNDLLDRLADVGLPTDDGVA